VPQALRETPLPFVAAARPYPHAPAHAPVLAKAQH